MLKFVVLLCAVSCALGAAIPEGMLPQLDGRIVGGNDTSISSIPYQVSIARNGRHHCGGSLIGSMTVLTAAHCTQSVSATVYMVRAGSSLCNSGGFLTGVESYKNHEGYNSRTMVNDISLIKLRTPVTMSSDIQPIALAITAPANGAAAIVSGWGTTSSGGSSPSHLRSALVDIVDDNICASVAYGYGPQIQKGMICAIAEGKDSCQGDSGGPLASDGDLVGIVSWGFGCAHPNYPGVYTDVSKYLDWIDNNK